MLNSRGALRYLGKICKLKHNYHIHNSATYHHGLVHRAMYRHRHRRWTVTVSWDIFLQPLHCVIFCRVRHFVARYFHRVRIFCKRNIEIVGEYEYEPIWIYLKQLAFTADVKKKHWKQKHYHFSIILYKLYFKIF